MPNTKRNHSSWVLWTSLVKIIEFEEVVVEPLILARSTSNNLDLKLAFKVVGKGILGDWALNLCDLELTSVGILIELGQPLG